MAEYKLKISKWPKDKLSSIPTRLTILFAGKLGRSEPSAATSTHQSVFATKIHKILF